MTVTWRDIARKDFEDAVRSKLLWGLTLTFVGLLSIFLVALLATESGEAEPLNALIFIASWSQFFVPLIALIVGYMAIVGERQSGSLRVLLSYPFSRASIVLGKVVGRTIVVTLTVLVGFVVILGLALVLIGVPSLVDAGAIILLTVGLALAFTAVAVGISAATRTRGMAMTLAVGTFFVLFILWEAVTVGVYYLVYGTRPGLAVESWYLLARQINPIEAYRATLTTIAGEYVWPLVNLSLEDYPMDVNETERMASERVIGDTPFYLSGWFTGVIFLAWIVVPLLAGYYRFRRKDIE